VRNASANIGAGPAEANAGSALSAHEGVGRASLVGGGDPPNSSGDAGIGAGSGVGVEKPPDCLSPATSIGSCDSGDSGGQRGE